MIVPVTEPLRLAVHVYTPTSDGPIFLSDRVTDISLPLVTRLLGIWRVPSGPTHWNVRVSVIPLGRVIEQVRVTVSPVGTESGWEEVTDIGVGSVKQQKIIHMNYMEPL